MHRNCLIICTLVLGIAIAPAVFGQNTNKPGRPDVPGTLLVDIGVNLLQNNNVDALETGIWGSKTVNVYYLHDMRLGNSKIYFLPGVGLGFDKYKFDEDVTLRPNPDNLDETITADPAVLIDGDVVVTKSKLAANFVDVPIEFRFYSNPDDISRSFKVGLGGKVGILYNSHTKVNYELNDNDNQIKHKQDLNLTKIRYGATARVGFGSFNLFAYYGLNELFEEGKGPEATEASTLSFGLTINAF